MCKKKGVGWLLELELGVGVDFSAGGAFELIMCF